jgi:hypothetical protein
MSDRRSTHRGTGRARRARASLKLAGAGRYGLGPLPLFAEYVASDRLVGPERAQRRVGLDATLDARVTNETARELHQLLVGQHGGSGVVHLTAPGGVFPQIAKRGVLRDPLSCGWISQQSGDQCCERIGSRDVPGVRLGRRSGTRSRGSRRSMSRMRVGGSCGTLSRWSGCVFCMRISRAGRTRAGRCDSVICMLVTCVRLHRHVVSRVRVLLWISHDWLIRRPLRRAVGLSVAAGARCRADQQERHQQPSRTGHVNDPEADDSGGHRLCPAAHASSADVAARQDWTRAGAVEDPRVSVPRLRDQ